MINNFYLWHKDLGTLGMEGGGGGGGGGREGCIHIYIQLKDWRRQIFFGLLSEDLSILHSDTDY